ncbi:MAG: hypothetical protein HYX91_00725 [Chloroflexi bacterium]|nr:hypothetical protein [Chloroflexota bacterium]
MATAVAVLGSLALIGWLIYRAFKGKPFKAHTIAYIIACAAGVFTFAFFLNMNISQLLKIFISILVGIILIIIAALLQRRQAGA